jgi:hypothetical protein
VDGKAVLLGM